MDTRQDHHLRPVAVDCLCLRCTEVCLFSGMFNSVWLSVSTSDQVGGEEKSNWIIINIHKYLLFYHNFYHLADLSFFGTKKMYPYVQLHLNRTEWVSAY